MAGRPARALALAALLVGAPAGLGARYSVARLAAARPGEEKGGSENTEVLERLFARTSLGDAAGPAPEAGGGEAGGAEEGGVAIHFNAEDDAFMGVVAKILALIEGSADGRVEKAAISAAAVHEEYPEFVGFVEHLFSHADADGDGSLTAEEAQHLIELLRTHVASSVMGLGSEEFDEAVGGIFELLSEAPEGGITKEALLKAATSEEHPELLEVAEELFAQADQDGDGVLDEAEAELFADLLEDYIGDDSSAGSSGDDEADESADETESASTDEGAEGA